MMVVRPLRDAGRGAFRGAHSRLSPLNHRRRDSSADGYSAAASWSPRPLCLPWSDSLRRPTEQEPVREIEL
jgi:hypothetical protein